MDVVVDHPRGVLEVQAFGEDVGGDQYADLLPALLRKHRHGHAVVVRREALDDVGPVAFGSAVDLRDAVDAGGVELPLEIAGRVCELGEDEHLLARQFLGLEQADELLQLVVVLGLELPGFIEELRDLVEVVKGLLDHLDDVVVPAIEDLDRV